MLNRIVCLAAAISIFFISTCPAAQTSDANFGIICVPAANLRGTASHESELYDQEIMGYTVKLFEKQDNWYKIQTEYGYVGWMTEKSFYRVDEAKLKQWKDCEKVRIVKVFATIYSKPNASSQAIAGVGMNVLLKKDKTLIGGWIKVETPDGRIGYLKKENCVDAVKKDLSQEELRKSIIETANLMMGTPYLWGGKSSTANDCSGFTSTVFRANGINIGRDSSKQAVEGKAVKYKNDFSNVLPGDLIFFGNEKVSHVAISLGGKEFIHQSGSVHITSFDPNSSYYEESYGKKIKAIKRFF